MHLRRRRARDCVTDARPFKFAAVKPTRRPSLRVFQAVLLGLALLCTIATPVVTFAQELHESTHALAHGDLGQPHSASQPDEHDGVFGEVLHAPHCCVHAAVVPQVELVTASIAPAEAPRSEPPTISSSPRSRLLRPPISA